MTSRDEFLASCYREDEELRREAIQAMMQHRATRKFLWFLLEAGNVFANPNPFSTEPLEMAKECGRIAVGQTVLNALLAVDPTIPLKLMEENQREWNDRNANAGDRGSASSADSWYAAGRTDNDAGDDGRGVDFYRDDDYDRDAKRRALRRQQTGDA
jgi:hypothetical protein